MAKGQLVLGGLSARPAGAQAQPWAHPYRPGWHMAATQQKMGGPRRNSRLRDFLLICGLIYNPSWVTQYLHVGSTKLRRPSEVPPPSGGWAR